MPGEGDGSLPEKRSRMQESGSIELVGGKWPFELESREMGFGDRTPSTTKPTVDYTMSLILST